jgi:hypothetical protein
MSSCPVRPDDRLAPASSMALIGTDTGTLARSGSTAMMLMTTISFTRHQFPPDVIRHAVWLYLRFTLSFRDVEDLLAERGLDLSYETVRRPPAGLHSPTQRGVHRLGPPVGRLPPLRRLKALWELTRELWGVPDRRHEPRSMSTVRHSRLRPNRATRSSRCSVRLGRSAYGGGSVVALPSEAPLRAEERSWRAHAPRMIARDNLAPLVVTRELRGVPAEDRCGIISDTRLRSWPFCLRAARMKSSRSSDSAPFGRSWPI